MKPKNPHAIALGRLSKGKTSPRKAKSSRRNGRKGGRPKAGAMSKVKRIHPAACCERYNKAFAVWDTELMKAALGIGLTPRLAWANAAKYLQTGPTPRCVCGHQQSTHAGGQRVCNGTMRSMGEDVQCHCSRYIPKQKGYQGL